MMACFIGVRRLAEGKVRQPNPQGEDAQRARGKQV